MNVALRAETIRPEAFRFRLVTANILTSRLVDGAHMRLESWGFNKLIGSWPLYLFENPVNGEKN